MVTRTGTWQTFPIDLLNGLLILSAPPLPPWRLHFDFSTVMQVRWAAVRAMRHNVFRPGWGQGQLPDLPSWVVERSSRRGLWLPTRVGSGCSLPPIGACILCVARQQGQDRMLISMCICGYTADACSTNGVSDTHTYDKGHHVTARCCRYSWVVPNGPCQQCPENTYSVGGTKGPCSTCPDGWLAPPGSNSMDDCKPPPTACDTAVPAEVGTYTLTGSAPLVDFAPSCIEPPFPSVVTFAFTAPADAPYTLETCVSNSPQIVFVTLGCGNQPEEECIVTSAACTAFTLYATAGKVYYIFVGSTAGDVAGTLKISLD